MEFDVVDPVTPETILIEKEEHRDEELAIDVQAKRKFMRFTTQPAWRTFLEREVLDREASDRELAARLRISPRTLYNHLSQTKRWFADGNISMEQLRRLVS